jgi:hypothetical protein
MTCRDRIVNEMSAIHDEYRSYVFGTRSDRDGEYTILTGGKADEERVGILEMHGRLTSEFVPPLVESYRALRCRMLDVCQVMKRSIQQKGGDVTVRTLGCDEEKIPLYSECFLSGDSTTGSTDAADTTEAAMELVTYCDQLTLETLHFERSALFLAVGYDSGYRASAQLAGMMDWIQSDVPSAVLRPLRDMVNLLGRLHQIPCFIGQCDYPPTQNL